MTVSSLFYSNILEEDILTPKLAIYLFSVSILCMLSLVGNVIVLDLFQRNMRIEKDMPKWVN
jgi:hypothetical protein